MPRVSTIAIDGPVASGKTAVGKLLAERLGFRFLDTGLMYRAVTWEALRRGVAIQDVEALTQIAQGVRLESNGPGLVLGRILAGKKDVTPFLRRPEVDRHVSAVAQVQGVRRGLVATQRRLARSGKIVMVGRDIGTVVLQDADLKVFLEASAKERARRRYQELVEQDQKVEYGVVLEEMKRRDKLDSERSLSPLRPAKDAHRVETDGIDVAEVVERILGLMTKE
ncbi:MAG: (d)CMP kinase [Chloroflexi bacterium]|nr:(d)CMP kinase [Chloroflexota bacterium]